ncbi:spore protease YyaC [Paenibacillus donghaensis]|uniref:Spore protease YyaC n=1 Tax=Paenibacillus donghaensis TaxID=414771 RepID=A0A2Z2K7S4_9BACL|nr:spore protease YyaC [Paenibacillus donghaensis]ASA22576.1 spore protease YyaC [Paenibacillus donghaensis]
MKKNRTRLRRVELGKTGLFEAIRHVIDKDIYNEDIVFVCIGTDRSTGDSLGPMVGTMLEQLGFDNVLGTIHNPVHAVNLKEKVDSIPLDKTIIAIDACLGNSSSVGVIEVFKGGISPGAGVGKDLGRVGDYSISGIVNVGGYMEYFVLQNTRLSLVMDMANQIANALAQMFGETNLMEVAIAQ